MAVCIIGRRKEITGNYMLGIKQCEILSGFIITGGELW